jgi:exodeoxyribonuclease VII small subunit
VDARELSFEEAFDQLEEAVARLEGGGLSIDEMVAQYEQGVALARLCRERLDTAQARVLVLAREPDETEDGLSGLSDLEEN